MAQINLNLAGIEAARPAGIVPAGDYNVKIVKSDVKPNNAQTGHYLELELEILDGEFKGYRVYDTLNLWHPNESTVNIAKRAVAAICDAIGIGRDVPDSELMHNKPLSASVKVQKGNAEYPDDKNKVKSYMAFKNGSAPVAMAPAFVPPAPVAAPAPVAPVAAPAPAFAPAAPVAAPSFAPPAGLPAFAPPAPPAAPQSFAPPAAPAAAPVPMAPVMAPPPAFAVPGAAPAPMAPAAGAPAPFAWQAQS